MQLVERSQILDGQLVGVDANLAQTLEDAIPQIIVAVVLPHQVLHVHDRPLRPTLVVMPGGSSAPRGVLLSRAAYGVSSPLRRQWIGDRPQGLGVQALVGDSPSTVDHPLLGGGYFMSLGDRGNSVFCCREHNSVHISDTRHLDAATEDRLDRDTIAGLFVEATARWHSPVPEAVAPLTPRRAGRRRPGGGDGQAGLQCGAGVSAGRRTVPAHELTPDADAGPGRRDGEHVHRSGPRISRKRP